MNRTARCVGITFLLTLDSGVPGVHAQQPVAAEPQAPSATLQAPREVLPPLPVPRLVKFAGTLKDELGKSRIGVVGVTFAIYKEQDGGAALWMETQNVELDEQGHYAVLLGATKNDGLPLELFIAGEPRWLGVQVNLPREIEQPRVLLVSVPYALKAADADTLGGKPASVYLTTEGGGGTTAKPNGSAGIISPAISGTGSTNVVAKWLDNVGTLGNSQISDDGTNVNMPGNVGALAYKFTGNATPPTDATATILNQAFVGPVFSGLSFKVRTGAPVPADALSIDTSQNASITGNASALAYKFTGNANPPTDATATIFNQAFVGPVFSGLSFKVRTGAPAPADALSIDPSQNVSVVRGNLMLSGAGNAIVFSDGTVQSTAVKGTGGGTITGITAGTGLTGGGNSGGVTLAINPAVVPQLGANTNTFTGGLTANSFTGSGAGLSNVNAAMLGGNPPSAFATTGANSFTGNQSITGNVSLTGMLALPNTSSATAGVITLGGGPFVHNFGLANTFVGALAGNTSASLTGTLNTGVGSQALSSNTGGRNNSAFGFNALNANTTGNFNAAFGTDALQANTTGAFNAAFGASALQTNTMGINNSAFGFSALLSAVTTSNNSAFGFSALSSNTTTNGNSAFGAFALSSSTTGGFNSAFGFNALTGNTAGSNNSAFGLGALQNLTSGDSNVAVGSSAGSNLPTGSNNIYIGNSGAGSESNTIRIGTVGTQTTTFIAGISGATSASGVAVLVNSSGQLGTTTSSRRFKHEIANMGAESDLLMKLRPVAFYYNPELDETQTRQYGLVAEEVAQVAPQLVVFDKDGAPQTVRYHFVNAMLLNEVQKQRLLVEEQLSTIARQQSKIQDLEARLARLEAVIAGR